MERWLKFDTTFPHGHTAQRIQSEFGRDGLLVWVCMLTAAKRNVPEGEVVYVGDGWASLALVPDPPFAFTLPEFLRLTGRLHLTSQRRSGGVVTISLRTWGDWQAEWRRDDARERMSRKRAVSDANTLRTQSEPSANGNRTEKEIEKEKEPHTPRGSLRTQGLNPRSLGTNPRAVDANVTEIYEHWRTARGKTDPRYLRISPGRRQKIESRLREFSADELHRAIDAVARDPWPERSLHDDLTVLFRSQEQVDKFLSLERKPTAAPCPECGIGGGTHTAECPVGHEQKARLR